MMVLNEGGASSSTFRMVLQQLRSSYNHCIKWTEWAVPISSVQCGIEILNWYSTVSEDGSVIWLWLTSCPFRLIIPFLAQVSAKRVTISGFCELVSQIKHRRSNRISGIPPDGEPQAPLFENIANDDKTFPQTHFRFLPRATFAPNILRHRGLTDLEVVSRHPDNLSRFSCCGSHRIVVEKVIFL